MKRTILGIVVASIVMYLWGFAYWGATSIPYQTWKTPADGDEARAALRNHFPGRGTYAVPVRSGSADEPKQYADGPVAMVYMTAPNGRPMMDPTIMGAGFLLNLAVIIVLAIQMRLVAPGLPSFGARFQQGLLAGLAATIMCELGDAVWWQFPWPWQLTKALYTFVAWLIVAAILAWFIDGRDAHPMAAAA